MSSDQGGLAPGLCLVYLAWTPYGLEAAERFLSSYRRHRAGTEHRLLVARAGPTADRSAWTALFDGVAERQLDLGAGMDLDHYRAAVEDVPAERYCFVNTVSEVLADDWLGHIERALLQPGVGMVATTGSYETPNAVRPGPLRRLRPGHPAFPNPHLRTNGFAMRRDLILDLAWPTGVDKLGAVALEGGYESLTRQVESRGLSAMVVGRDGVAYPPEHWRESQTFRSGEQANLLLADNRTRHYQDGGFLVRRGLAWLAWQRWR